MAATGPVPPGGGKAHAGRPTPRETSRKPSRPTVRAHRADLGGLAGLGRL